MNILIQLFLTFAKIGAVIFGGGYAMLPILQREVVDSKHWVRDEELMDYYAIGQCTPGVIAVNVSTFVGNKLAGISGGIAATLGVITPSIIIITIISFFLNSFEHNVYVMHAFVGIRACVVVLILDTVIRMIRKSVKDTRQGLIFTGILLGALFSGVSPAVLVLVAAVAGYFFMPESLIKREDRK